MINKILLLVFFLGGGLNFSSVGAQTFPADCGNSNYVCEKSYLHWLTQIGPVREYSSGAMACAAVVNVSEYQNPRWVVALPNFGEVCAYDLNGVQTVYAQGWVISQQACRSPDSAARTLVSSYVVQDYSESIRGRVWCVWKNATSLQLTLTGPGETRPAGTGGLSGVTFIARVTEGAVAKSGVAISFSADVTANSGGHDHHNMARPKGALSLTQGATEANGEVKVTFSAPDVSGIHTLKATCASCANSSATKEIQVKVPNLVEMLPDTARPASYTLVGSTGNHKSNHWFSSASVVTLGKVVDAMFKTGWGTVGVNDGSLMWGGLFDIKGNWKTPHSGHRNGTEVDLSFKFPKSISEEQKTKTYAELCKANNTAFTVQTLWHVDDGYEPHFHLYLDGTGLTKEAGGGPCCAQYKTTRVKKDKNGNVVLGKDGKPEQVPVTLCTETSPR